MAPVVAFFTLIWEEEICCHWDQTLREGTPPSGPKHTDGSNSHSVGLSTIKSEVRENRLLSHVLRLHTSFSCTDRLTRTRFHLQVLNAQTAWLPGIQSWITIWGSPGMLPRKFYLSKICHSNIICERLIGKGQGWVRTSWKPHSAGLALMMTRDEMGTLLMNSEYNKERKSKLWYVFWKTP